MAPKRTRKPKLPRLIDHSNNVIAVVDQNFEIIYVNEACAAWYETSAEQLVGTPLKFGHSPDTLPGPGTGLCPEPCCFDLTGPAQSSGHIFVNRNGKRVWKSASFNRISDAEDGQYVVVIANGPDLLSIETHAIQSRHVELQRLFDQIEQQDQRTSTIEQIIGNSAPAIRLRRQIEAVSTNQSDCLIIGPSGSGKEHIARTIFGQRGSPATNLIPIHCAIADSEFLQRSIKEWALEQRENQSVDWLLMLDIDRMNPESQIELFGFTQIPDFPLRMIATSESNLLQLAEQERFHFELANHVSVQTIELAPLLNRKTDIPLLCQFFIESWNQNSNHQITDVSDQVLEIFYEYNWPENIAELKRVTIEACQACNQSRITHEHLSRQFKHAMTASRIGYHEFEQIELDSYLGEIEKELIRRALLQAKNNKTKAADLLGISRAKLLRRATLYDLIKAPRDDKANEQIDSSAFKEAEN